MKKTTQTLTAITALIAMQAAAQTAQPAQAPEAPAPSAAEQTAPESWAERESLFLEKIIPQKVSDRGFTPIADWTGEMWNNVSGGSQNQMSWNSLLHFGFEQDLSKLSGSSASLGRLGITMYYYASDSDFANAGQTSDASNIFTGAAFRVFEVYYANEFETDAGNFSLRIGQLAADEDFMGLDYADLFLNSSFGAIPAVAGGSIRNGAIAFSQYANATAGIVLGYEKSGFEAKVGLYNGNAGLDISSNNGFDYDLQGVALWYQLGYNYSISGLAGKIAFGGSYNSNEFADFETGEASRNLYSFYVLLQQDLLNDDEGNAVLGGFARFAYNPSRNIAETAMYLDAGLNWFGPIPCRKDDIFGVAFGLTESEKAFRNSEGLPQYESCLETTYRLQLTKAIALQPAFQVYFKPAGDNGDRGVKYVIGVRAEVAF